MAACIIKGELDEPSSVDFAISIFKLKVFFDRRSNIFFDHVIAIDELNSHMLYFWVYQDRRLRVNKNAPSTSYRISGRIYAASFYFDAIYVENSASSFNEEFIFTSSYFTWNARCKFLFSSSCMLWPDCNESTSEQPILSYQIQAQIRIRSSCKKIFIWKTNCNGSAFYDPSWALLDYSMHFRHPIKATARLICNKLA